MTHMTRAEFIAEMTRNIFIYRMAVKKGPTTAKNKLAQTIANAEDAMDDAVLARADAIRREKQQTENPDEADAGGTLMTAKSNLL